LTGSRGEGGGEGRGGGAGTGFDTEPRRIVFAQTPK
jgi:hypothetical protein